MMDLDRPFHPYPQYLQAMMLALLWNPRPRCLHVIGLGGGCFLRTLHHYFPALLMDCSEIDARVPEIARRYFGLPEHPNIRIIVQDGRAFLEQRQPASLYDIIVVDAHRGVGFSPLRLATAEFLCACKAQLGQTGVLVVNLLEGDCLLKPKLDTLAGAFRNVEVFEGQGSLVLLASDARQIAPVERLSRAAHLDRDHRFTFSLARLAAKLVSLESYQLRAIRSGPIKILSDHAVSCEHPPIDQDILDLVGRNNPCPCGSGRKFKHCHSAPQNRRRTSAV